MIRTQRALGSGWRHDFPGAPKQLGRRRFGVEAGDEGLEGRVGDAHVLEVGDGASDVVGVRAGEADAVADVLPPSASRPPA